MRKRCDSGECVRQEAEILRSALEVSTQMLEAMMVHMRCWEIEPIVNVQGRIAANNAILVKS